MNKRSYAIAALAVAGVIFSAGLVIADEADEDDMMTGAGGGGWWKDDGPKITFGLYLDPGDNAMSEFVLQARDLGETVHAYQFDSVVINYNADDGTGSATASGRAYVAGADAAFTLTIVDGGDRSMDSLELVLSDGYDGHWMTPDAGLGGGQIWVYLE